VAFVAVETRRGLDGGRGESHSAQPYFGFKSPARVAFRARCRMSASKIQKFQMKENAGALGRRRVLRGGRAAPPPPHPSRRGPLVLGGGVKKTGHAGRSVWR